MDPSPNDAASWARAPRYRFRLTLRAAIAASLLFVTVSLAVAMAVINSRGSTAALRTATGALMRSSVDLVAAQTEALLGQVAARVQVSAVVLADPSMEGLDHVEMLLFALVDSGDDLYYAQFGAANGDFVLVRRNDDGGLETQRIVGGDSTRTIRSPNHGLGQHRERRAETNDYDPRLRPWFNGAISSDDLFWTRAYAHAGTGEPVVTAARTVRASDGTLLGVVSVTLSLSHLNRYLRGLSSANTLVFLADERDQLVALSDGVLDIDHTNPAALQLPQITQAPFPQVAAFGDSDLFNGSPVSATAAGFHRMVVGDDAYLAVARALTPMRGRDWTVGAVVPEAHVLAQVRRSMTTSAAVAVVVITLFVLLGVALARTLAGPLTAIAHETRRIQRLELQDGHMAASRFEEIAEIQDAYAHLKVGLRAFEKYVPVKLVRTLLTEQVDPEPGGQAQEVTLFFSDIRGFTSFAHSVSVKELSEVLSLYLKRIVDEIDGTGGTVDKIVGDGVMAFWNAPRAVSNHPLEAVRTAIRCRDAIASMSHSNQLFTRIGIHTGEALIGNFGSPNRFSYTALGDAVNLASRLEGANKHYHSQIMISAATEARLDDTIVRRHLDRIAVVGRSEGVDIYEVLGFAGAVDDDTVGRARHYERALGAYFDGRFEEAETMLDTLEGDPASRVIAERCRHYRTSPPSANWDGVYALIEK